MVLATDADDLMSASASSTLRSGTLRSAAGGTLRSTTLKSARDEVVRWASNSPSPTVPSPADLLAQEQSVSTTTANALHEVCRLGNVSETQILIDNGAKLNTRDQLGRTAMHCAAAGGHTQIVQMLASAGASLELTDKVGMTPLLWTAWFGHIDTLRLLVNQGANIHAVNLQGQSILHCAAVNDQTGVMLFILDLVQGFDINIRDKQLRTSLYVVAERGNIEVVDKLLELKCDVSRADKAGKTALHMAAQSGHEDVIRKLLLFGVEVEERDADGCTALYLAAANGHQKIINIMLSCNADPNVRTSKGMTALMAAAMGGHSNCVKILLELKCDVNAANNQGNTSLHLAAIANQVKVVQMLLSANSDINKQNERLQTALHAAVEDSASAEVVEMLLMHGADFDLPEKGGKTALGLASRASMIGIVDMIITAERHQTTQKAAQLANGLECGAAYHHCFYQTSCSALCEKASSDVVANSNSSSLKRTNPQAAEYMKDILWKLATKQLKPNEWKKLAKHWEFSDAQLRAIEHQYTGTDSYKQHGYRMLLIWLNCLHKNDNPIKQLFVALVAIDRRELAEEIRSHCNINQQRSISLNDYCSVS